MWQHTCRPPTGNLGPLKPQTGQRSIDWLSSHCPVVRFWSYGRTTAPFIISHWKNYQVGCLRSSMYQGRFGWWVEGEGRRVCLQSAVTTHFCLPLLQFTISRAAIVYPAASWCNNAFWDPSFIALVTDAMELCPTVTSKAVCFRYLMTGFGCLCLHMYFGDFHVI